MASLVQEKKKQKYQTYMADVLRLIGENIAGITKGSFYKTTWSDIVNPRREDNRTGDEIARDIIKRAKLKTKGGE